MGGFEELLESAGFLRDDTAVGAIDEADRPSPEEVEKLYDEVAEAAGVGVDDVLLEFAPMESKRAGRSQVNVALWYDGDLTSKERHKVVEVLRTRFGISAPSKPKRSRAARSKKKATRKAS